MKILQLNIEGFRSLKKVEWKPGDLNVVIGPNASGKSNLLEAIELLPHIANGSLSEHLQALGGIDSIAWNHEAKDVVFDCMFKTEKFSDHNYDPQLQYRLELRREGQRNQYHVSGENLTEWMREKAYGNLARPHTNPQYIDRISHKALVQDSVGATVTMPNDSVNDEESLFGARSKPSSTPALAFQLYAGSAQIFKSFRTDDGAAIRSAQIARVKKRLRDEIDLANVLHTLYTNDSNFEEEIDLAMSAAFADYDKLVFPPSSEQRIELAVKWKSIRDPQPAVTLSDGTLRFLFLITALVAADTGGLVAIDEPETGLHPRMFGIVAEYAVEAARKAQVIFTTHSPEFLDAFTDTKPITTVAQSVDGETRLAIPDQERMEYWLKHYSLGEMFISHDLENLVEA